MGWKFERHKDNVGIHVSIATLESMKTVTFREREIINLCIDYLEGILHRWEICSPTSRREYLEADK